MEQLPIVATVHESHIAKRIDDAPIRGLSTLIDITNTINELFGKRLIDQIQLEIRGVTGDKKNINCG